jgi:SnoaL-like domain
MAQAAADDRIRALLDRQEIVEVLVRFCRGVDRLDPEMIRSCLHDDAIDDHGMFRGGPEELAAYLVASGRSMVATVHYITNVTLRLDGDRAASEAYVTAMMRMPRSNGGEADHLVLGRYLDRFERRDGGPWLIAERTVVYDLTRIDPAGAQWSLGASYTRGRRDRGDLSYALLGR